LGGAEAPPLYPDPCPYAGMNLEVHPNVLKLGAGVSIQISNYPIFSIIAVPNSEVLSLVAPSINLSKS